MNIKEHIEAGHYLADDKGRALVPMDGGDTATIVATDAPMQMSPILGWDRFGCYRWWTVEGSGDRWPRLLPPPPRKVKVERWLVVRPTDEFGPYTDRGFADEVARAQKGIVVPLTGEYEEPWT